MPSRGKRTPKKKACNFVRGVRSPLLANIYLDELDRYMESNYLTLSEYERNRRRKQGKSNFLYVRYADDFVVLCNGTKAQAHAMKEELRGVLSSMGLTLSEEKTKVTHITEGFTFLGYRVIREIGASGKMVPKVFIPDSAIKKFRHKIREITAPSTSKESVKAKIMALNSVIRGWCNYYRCTSSPSQIFGKLNPEVYWGMAHWLGRKYRKNIPVIIRKFNKGSTFGTSSIRLVMPSDIKAKKRLVTAWHNPYTAKEEIIRERLLALQDLWNGNEYRREWHDLREEVIRLKGTTCYKCGVHLHESEVEIDHAIKPRAWFKDKTEADRMKHLQPICTSCHRVKTKADREVVSRMR
jgi:5-methylcytosine-specific restriction endonuclease McrA